MVPVGPLQQILVRRSIRSFTDQEVVDETVKILLRAAMQAPSAGNQQPWRFVVVRDRQVLEKLADMSPYAGAAAGAALAVVVLGDAAGCPFAQNWAQDCAAATQNLLLEATHQGLGSVWLGVYPEKDREEKVARVLNVPEGITPFAVVALGYSKQANEFVDRYDPEKVRFESF